MQYHLWYLFDAWWRGNVFRYSIVCYAVNVFLPLCFGYGGICVSCVVHASMNMDYLLIAFNYSADLCPGSKSKYRHRNKEYLIKNKLAYLSYLFLEYFYLLDSLWDRFYPLGPTVRIFSKLATFLAFVNRVTSHQDPSETDKQNYKNSRP